MKNVKRLIMITVILFSPLFLTGFNQRAAFFYVENMTNYSIIIEREIAPSESNRPFEWYRTYHSEDGLSIHFFVQSISTRKSSSKWVYVTPPQESAFGFDWYPVDLFDKIPPLEKIKLFYSVLNISDSEGNILFTLDTITENDLKINENGSIYLVVNPAEQNR